MSVQFAPKSESFGGKLGTALGQGVGSGLSSLIEKKVDELHKNTAEKKRAVTYRKAGLPTWLAELPEEKQDLFLKEFELMPDEIKPQFIEAMENIGIEDVEGSQQAQQEDQEQQQEGLIPQQMQKQPTPSGHMEQAERSTIPGMNTLQQAGQSQRSSQGQSSPVQAFPQEVSGTSGAPAPQGNFEPQVPQTKELRQRQPERPRGLQRKGAAGSSAPTRKEAAAEQKAIDAATKASYESINKDYDKAKRESKTLKRMNHLVNKGDLPFSVFYKSLKDLEEHVSPEVGVKTGAAIGGVIGGALGLSGGPLAIPAAAGGAAIGAAVGSGIGAIINPIVTQLRNIERQIYPDVEEFEKLSASFISGAKAMFGARVTNDELKAYMLTIPTLANTDKGKKAIIRDMEIVNEAAEVKYKASQQVIKNNGGRRPLDYDAQVEALSADKLDRLAQEFIIGEKKTLQQQGSKTVRT